ncbi:MAG TPA: folylpolyglutamate synthase/dihydrofolate synthase family protein [Polyangiales bacterium]|nr:folylpolyglutamate synthase/dihydrofolate synthase family protein [Polyangiales bacterium]
MRYEAAIRELFALQSRGMRLGIERMREGIGYRGLDLAALPPTIQVAGTNGKGSVAAMLASVLSAAGYRTGLFTSPHLHRFTERIRIDGEPISTREAARRSGELLAFFAKKNAPFMSFFELTTLMAVETFRDHQCDVAVMEVGLGGRQDATNAFPAMLTVITRIARDHVQFLGHRLSQIAREKAGIIKPGVPVIVGSRVPAATRVIRGVARKQRAPLSQIDRDFTPLSGGTVRVGKRRYQRLRVALAGAHQNDNAACTVAAVSELNELGWEIPERALRSGLGRVRWPARLEHIPGKPAFLIDAAHNADGCAALAGYLHGLPRRRRVLMFGVMQDKDYRDMLRHLAPEVDAVYYAQPSLARAADPLELDRLLHGTAARSVSDALRRARRDAGASGLVIIAGSIFLAAEARAKLLRVPTDPLIRL